jgi:two-component system chemotaxis response regulator CheB
MVLQTILNNLPNDLPVPVVIVQHIAKGFLPGFCDWLNTSSNLPVKIAKDGEILIPGNVYIAPDDLQMGILPGIKIKLEILSTECGLCPSVDFLFRSVAEVLGSNAIGVLLSGMGKDGAKELKNMKDKGAITLVQDEASCVVFGMPGEAVRIGAADQVLMPARIAGVLSDLCNKYKNVL